MKEFNSLKNKEKLHFDVYEQKNSPAYMIQSKTELKPIYTIQEAIAYAQATRTCVTLFGRVGTKGNTYSYLCDILYSTENFN